MSDLQNFNPDEWVTDEELESRGASLLENGNYSASVVECRMVDNDYGTQVEVTYRVEEGIRKGFERKRWFDYECSDADRKKRGMKEFSKLCKACDKKPKSCDELVNSVFCLRVWGRYKKKNGYEEMKLDFKPLSFIEANGPDIPF